MAHINATINQRNQTLTGGRVSHVGQLYFDQKLIHEVESFAPYTTNQQELLLNADDAILALAAATSDPVFNYVYLGDSVEDGIFGWVTVGINSTTSITPWPAVHYGENGGVINPEGTWMPEDASSGETGATSSAAPNEPIA